MDHRPKYKSQKNKSLEENIGGYPHKLGVVENFLSRSHTHIQNGKLVFIKIKYFCSSKVTIKNVK